MGQALLGHPGLLPTWAVLQAGSPPGPGGSKAQVPPCPAPCTLPVSIQWALGRRGWSRKGDMDQPCSR